MPRNACERKMMEARDVAKMTSPMLIVGTRIHWQNHQHDRAIDVDQTLKRISDFCARASSYADAIVLAVGLPFNAVEEMTREQRDAGDAFHDSIRELLKRLTQHQAMQRDKCALHLLPMTHWGKFVPALNAIVATAASLSPDATYLVLQSLEVQVDAAGVAYMKQQLDLSVDLVVGSALPGHAYQPSHATVELTGVTTPWNTLALWNLRQLSKVGFLLVGDGIGIYDMDASGVEEACTIATFQHLYPTASCAKLVAVPGVAWDVQDLQDEERRKWQKEKMASKFQRAEAQLKLLDLPRGTVLHT